MSTRLLDMGPEWGDPTKLGLKVGEILDDKNEFTHFCHAGFLPDPVKQSQKESVSLSAYSAHSSERKRTGEMQMFFVRVCPVLSVWVCG